MSKTVLVVGGSGVFGSRLVERLAPMECTLVIAGRSQRRAEQLIASLSARQPRATLRSLVLDRERVTAEQLRAAGASIVVDAAGPFQGQEPALARAAIGAGCHFIDLADARDYVAKFPALDADARGAGVLAVCGASATPSLSHAVLDELCAQAGAPSEVVIAITPGNRAPRGLAVVQALLSYVGHPVKVLEEGVVRTHPGWSLLHRRRVDGLGRRWFSLCETPDLDLVPLRFPTVRTVHFHAGLELGVLHCGLWILSLLVRARLLRSLRPWASGLHATVQRCGRFGTDRGGMLVEAVLWSETGCRTHARWQLIAAAGDGPYVPVLPALALIRKLLCGAETRHGAKACAGLLTLPEIMDEAAGLSIDTARQFSPVPALFKRSLGADFERMPMPIRVLHSPRATTVFEGLADIDAGANRVANLLARCCRFPGAARQVPVQVTIQAHEHCEVWRRRFGSSGFASVMRSGPRLGLMSESFGLLRCQLRVTADERGLQLSIESARLAGMPLPLFLVPWTRATERVDEHGRFNFDVEIGLRWIGRLVRYRGWLACEAGRRECGR